MNMSVVVAFARPGPLGLTLEAQPDDGPVLVTAARRSEHSGLLQRGLLEVGGIECAELPLPQVVQLLAAQPRPFCARFSSLPTDPLVHDEQGALPEPHPPPELLCPITHSGFFLPALMPSGHRYELAAIVKWWGMHGTDPLTRAPLELDQPPTVDLVSRAAADAWRAAVKLKYLAAVRRAREAGELERQAELSARGLLADPQCMWLHGERLEVAGKLPAVELAEAREAATEAFEAAEANEQLLAGLERWGEFQRKAQLAGTGYQEALSRLRRESLQSMSLLMSLSFLSRPMALPVAVGGAHVGVAACAGLGLLAGLAVLWDPERFRNTAAGLAAQASERMPDLSELGLPDLAQIEDRLAALVPASTGMRIGRAEEANSSTVIASS